VSGIGTLGEHHLHAALKEWYRQPGDRTEVGVDGFVVDLLRGEREIIEIQTRGFSKMRRKLDHLLDRHPVRIVHPIAAEKWIRKIDKGGAQLSRRKSPKRGRAADICSELISFPMLLSHPNFEVEVLLVQEEEVRRRDPKAWRRQGWGIVERRLVDVLTEETVRLKEPRDLLRFLPGGLPATFTTADLAEALDQNRDIARDLAYCLREAGVLPTVGRSRAGILYAAP